MCALGETLLLAAVTLDGPEPTNKDQRRKYMAPHDRYVQQQCSPICRIGTFMLWHNVTMNAE